MPACFCRKRFRTGSRPTDAPAFGRRSKKGPLGRNLALGCGLACFAMACPTMRQPLAVSGVSVRFFVNLRDTGPRPWARATLQTDHTEITHPSRLRTPVSARSAFRSACPQCDHTSGGRRRTCDGVRVDVPVTARPCVLQRGHQLRSNGAFARAGRTVKNHFPGPGQILVFG